MTEVRIRVRNVSDGMLNEFGSIIDAKIELDDGEEIVDIQRPNPFSSFYVFTKTEM